MSTTENIHVFCQNIIFLRNKFNLTVDEMADKLQIDTATLELLEQGIIPKDLGIEIFQLLNEEFAVPISDVFLPLW